MEKKAVFPGSFDPITIGHEAIIKRALPLFDEVLIAVGINSTKPSLYSPEQRVEWIKTVFEGEKKVNVKSYTGLTVNFVKEQNANYILRGLRTSADFEFERAIAQVNKKMYPELETIFLLTTPELTPVNSTIVRDILRNGGDASMFLPEKIKI
jgi:pantetheine-phosphate adenylyltransferase